MESLHASLIAKAKAKVSGLFALQPMCWKFFVEVESSGGAGFGEAVESKAIDVVRVIPSVVDVVDAVGALELDAIYDYGSCHFQNEGGLRVFAFCHCGRG